MCIDLALNNLFKLERFSIECRKIKTKVITMANHNKRKHHNKPMKTRRNARDRRQAREIACDKVAIGFGFASDWLRWRDFFKPITDRSKVKPKQFRITFDTRLKIALFVQHG